MMAGAGAERAVFVDRDGTLIQERDYLSDPAQVELLPGVVDSLAGFQDDGYRIVVITNQSGIARGLFDEAAYHAVRTALEDQLRTAGIQLLATYHCPHHPAFTGPCACRKPAPGLFRRAAREHGLDLSRSVYIGDRVRDVVTGLELGGLPILVRTGYGSGEEEAAPAGVTVVEDMPAALRAARAAPPGVDTPPAEPLV